jgi:hypothetical protein
MKLGKWVAVTALSSFLLSSAVYAAGDYEFYDFQSDKIYAGGGISFNDISWGGYDTSMGLQGFAGWDFFRFRDLTVAGEVGYFYAGTFKHSQFSDETLSGPYVNAVAKYPLNDTVWVQGRVGQSFISDLGSNVVGGGFGFNIMPKFAIRTEVARYGQMNSLRAEAVIKF